MNNWINHVKNYATKYNISYSEALKNSNCRETYKKQSGNGLFFSLFNDRPKNDDRYSREQSEWTKQRLNTSRKLRTAYRELNTMNEGTLEYRRKLQEIREMQEYLYEMKPEI